MNCDERKVQDIIAQMTKLYRDLSEVKKQIEEKSKELSVLTVGHIPTDIRDINSKLEVSTERFRILVYEIETKAAAIIQLDRMKTPDSSKTIIPQISPTTNKNVPRFTMTITEEEALTAIASSIKKNKEVTNMVNSEITKELKALQK